jgi:hypothetical protein
MRVVFSYSGVSDIARFLESMESVAILGVFRPKPRRVHTGLKVRHCTIFALYTKQAKKEFIQAAGVTDSDPNGQGRSLGAPRKEV